MSLNPHWYSTLFGFLMMGGQGLAALAFTIIVATLLVKHGAMAELLKPNHFHDLGKLMFAFVMLWAYFNFSQFLLTYAANLIEEIPYFVTRTSNGWQYLALFLVVFHFAVPLLLLLSRDRKRNPVPARVGGGVDPVRALRRPLHAGRAGVRRRPARTCTWPPGSTRATSSCTGSTWRRRSPSAGCGSGCSSRSSRSGRCCAVRDPYLREALESGGGH